MDRLDTVTKISWNEANETCASYNASLPSFSSHNDVLTVQSLLMETHEELMQFDVFIGLFTNITVSN